MAIYSFIGIDETTGKNIKNTIQADDPVDLKRILKDHNIILSDYTQLKEKRRSNFFAVSSKAKKGEFVTFCKQFAIMLTAGCSIIECLDTLRKQNFSTVFKNDISDAYEEVLKGCLLSEAFRLHSKNFPNFFISMVYVGELSGNLPTTLVRAADYYENDQKTKRKAKSALIYPVFLLVIVILIFFLLFTFVIPNFAGTLQQEGVELPLLTKIIMAISNFITDNILPIIVALIVLVGAGMFFFKKTKTGKYAKSRLGWHFPIIRTITKNTVTTRFGTAFAILIDSGMQVIDCMKVMPQIINNPIFTKRFKFAVEEVNNGKKLSRAIENTEIFPPMLISMVVVGENTSTLGQVLQVVGEYYNSVLAASITKATSLLEPVAIILLGGLVLIVILSVMLPMFQMVTNVK